MSIFSAAGRAAYSLLLGNGSDGKETSGAGHSRDDEAEPEGPDPLPSFLDDDADVASLPGEADDTDLSSGDASSPYLGTGLPCEDAVKPPPDTQDLLDPDGMRDLETPSERDANAIDNWEGFVGEAESRLRAIARGMQTKYADYTPGVTDTVNEVFLRVKDGQARQWSSSHFFGFAARAIRSIVVDYVRRKRRLKRTAPGTRVSSDVLDQVASDFERRAGGDLDSLNAALERLAESNPVQAEIVDLKFFAGRTVKEISQLVGMPERSVQREFEKAKERLKREISRDREQ
ncbi:MAG: sigma-70 family RNA polymerase sigma factor [Planctomycetota bacterium]